MNEIVPAVVQPEMGPVGDRLAAKVKPQAKVETKPQAKAETKAQAKAKVKDPAKPQPKSKVKPKKLNKKDEKYLTMVMAVEKRLGRKVCGARLVSGFPCEHEGSEGNGRCNWHGGILPEGWNCGKQNARKHGIYIKSLSPNEMGMAEEMAIAIANEYKASLRDPMVKRLIQDIVIRTVQIDRADAYIKRRGIVVKEVHPDFTIEKTSPGVDPMLRVIEVRRRMLDDLNRIMGRRSMVDTSDIFDPSTRDAILYKIFSECIHAKGEVSVAAESSIRQLLATSPEPSSTSAGGST